jgi:hypothetical protein
MVIEALVSEAERPGLVAAAEHLSECLGAAMEATPWPVRLGLRAPGGAIAADPAPTVVIASLLPEVARTNEPIDDTKARWRAYLSRLLESGAPVLVCTVFRHIADRAKAGAPSPTLDRIRRLDRMAADLSNELGVGVIDIDRALAHVGGRVLQTDYRLAGVLATEVVAHTVAWSLLSFGLDEAVDPTLQEKAKTILRDINHIDAVVNERLARRAKARTAGG